MVHITQAISSSVEHPRAVSQLSVLSLNMKFTAAFALLPLALAAPANLQKRAAPTVVAPSPQATVGGKDLLGVETFNGIPYAQAPLVTSTPIPHMR